jgi:hypothetical protein
MRSSVAALALLLAGPARAQVVDAASTTLLAGRADPRDGRVYTAVPLYEIVSLELRDVRAPLVEDLRAVVSGWGSIDPASGSSFDGDLDVAYVEGGLFKHRLSLRAGRQLVVGGAARLAPLDGLAARLRLWSGLHVDAFGGVPVTPRFGVRRGDAMAGGRVSYRFGFGTEVGLSFVHVHDHGRSARQEVAADARWDVLRTLALTGYAALSTLEARLAEADVAADWQPLGWIELRADYRRTAPDLFIPRSSIFSVFTTMSRDEGGASLFLRPLPRLRLEGDAHVIHDELGIGYRAFARVRARLGAAYQSSVGVEAGLLELPENGYARARLTATHAFLPELLLTVDGEAYFLDHGINAQRWSLSGAATLGWEFAAHWSAVAALIADTTPLVTERIEGMIKLVYNRTIRVHEVLR